MATAASPEIDSCTKETDPDKPKSVSQVDVDNGRQSSHSTSENSSLDRISNDKAIAGENGLSAEEDRSFPIAISDDSNLNVVDWDGPDDPANPRNWSKTFKMVNISLLSISVLYCNLATTMYAPGANIMEREFGVTNQMLEILTITIASLGFALGQLFVAPLSELYGRLPLYRASAIFYLGFTAGCARSTNVAELLVFRCLTGCAAASYMSCGGGTIADLLPQEERGAAVALFTAGPLLGPVCPTSNCPFLEN